MMWFCGGHGLCNVDSDGAGGAHRGLAARRRAPACSGSTATSRATSETRTGPAVRVDRPERRVAREPRRLSAQARRPPQGLERRRDHPARRRASTRRRASSSSRAPIRWRRSRSASSRRAARRSSAPRRCASPTRRPAPRRTRTDGLTHIYGQIVDLERNVVVGNQATPIPIKLDGEEHTIRAQLTRIANVAPDAGFELQLIGQSNLFDAQRAAGAVTISDLEARLPITKPRTR